LSTCSLTRSYIFFLYLHMVVIKCQGLLANVVRKILHMCASN
jgi:hypothetical protein